MPSTSTLAKIGVLGALVLLVASQARAGGVSQARRAADGTAYAPNTTTGGITWLQAEGPELDKKKMIGATVANAVLNYFTFGIYGAINKAATALGSPDGGVMAYENAQRDWDAVQDSWYTTTHISEAVRNPQKVDIAGNISRSVTSNVISNVKSLGGGTTIKEPLVRKL